jgi:endogenous inhibitor of DNA gyrase (YacG/DUF329 family)
LIDLGRWLGEEHSIPFTAGEDDQPEGGSANRSGDEEARPPVRLPPGWHDA